MPVEEAAEFTQLVRELLAYACGGSTPLTSPAQGRQCPHVGFGGDPVYNAVTEGRHARAIKGKQFYSSCGDLAHWLLYRLGLRFPWINRDELDGWHYSGQPGQPRWDNNVTTLCCKAKSGVNTLARVPFHDDFHLVCGDILVVNTHDPITTHVSAVYEHRPEDHVIVSADYGQPGGAIRERSYAVVNGRIKIGSRWLDSVLPIMDLIEVAEAVSQRAVAEPAHAWAKRLHLEEP